MSQNNDDEIIEKVVSVLYNNGVFAYVTMDRIKFLAGLELDKLSELRILRRLDNEGLLEFNGARGSLDGAFLEYLDITLSKEGRTIMLTHGSYKAYKKSKRKKTNSDSIDRNIRNGNIIAALLISITTVFLTQCPTRNSKEQKKTEEKLQSIQEKLDSLLQVLPQSQKH